jgi:hypothetical protein
MGGFGAGSDFTWQVFPSLGLGLGNTASLESGYRWLEVDYATGEGDEQCSSGGATVRRRTVVAFSTAHGDQNEKDHAAPDRAVRSGKVNAVFEEDR